MEVPIRREIVQILGGTHYKGSVRITDTRFDYKLVFGVPIGQINILEPAGNEDELRHLYQITVSCNGAEIELTKEEYLFFSSLVVELAIVFYNLNPSSSGGSLADKKLYPFSPETCEMLSTPKFGWALVTV